ncbi:MAG: nucleotidyltransferase domain-containing protein [Chitinophagaceae bacterium]|nr:nucleotidyltransferase domain-containing protein [Chitinophagaceae bacterium]
MKSVQNINDLFLLFSHNNLYRQYGLKRIGVFGSFARGEKFNDIDLFIEEEINFRQVLQLKELLERETGMPVDIMQKKYAEPVILYRALKDMKYAAAS